MHEYMSSIRTAYSRSNLFPRSPLLLRHAPNVDDPGVACSSDATRTVSAWPGDDNVAGGAASSGKTCAAMRVHPDVKNIRDKRSSEAR